MIANYQIGKRIASTAGGHLHQAQLQDSGLAILKLPPADALVPAQLARFRREFDRLQSLDIAGVIKPLALVGEPTRPIMVLPYFDGEPLAAFIERQLLDISTCLRLGSQLAQILAGLHAAGFMHRDVRPANLWLTPQPQRLLLLDLSLAADLRGASGGDGEAPGDWAYVSPEQTGRMNRSPDYRADAYSLGVTLYRMLTRRLPFAAADPLEWVHCHVARLPPPPRDVDPAIPQAVSDIVMKLLAKAPEARYQSMQGAQADLERCLAQWEADGRIEPFALGAEDFPEQFYIPHKLYGREQALASLLDAFARMAAGGQPALATVCGYSGIGKSALAHELQQPIVRERGYFIAGKFDQYLRDTPYATLTQAFRDLIRQLLAESDARIEAWRQAIRQAVGAHGQLMVDILPQIELLIGKQTPVAALPPAEAQHRFRRVFRRFLGVFAQPAHPLVLFLDDAQWIDAASLQLIEHLLMHADTRYLLLIAAYRDNEVGAAHPLRSSLEAIRGGGAPVTEVQLGPLPADALNRLVADALHAPPPLCEPLTDLIFAKTEGNPFFFTQFLATLHREGLLRRDVAARAWRWDLAQIQGRDFADNVVDLMLGKLRALPEPTQQALRLAACLGNRFALDRLALVSDLNAAAIEQRLTAAAADGLVMLAGGDGRFLHDRIQQAAYSLIPERERGAIHLRIGRLLTQRLNADDVAEHLFDVANQLNRGVVLLTDREEKAQVADINLRAGRKAKASAAHASACMYFAAGMALLDEHAWEGRYRLAFDLWLERALCEFLSGHLDEAMGFVSALLQRELQKVDQANASNLKVLLHVVKSEIPQALDTALICLPLFGIELPPHPTWEQIQNEYDGIWRNMEGRSIESLIDIPLMTDLDMQAVMRMLSALILPAAFTDMNLRDLLFCRMVNLSLQHGMSNESAYGCAAFESVLGAVFHRYHDAYRFSQLACALVEKHDFVADKAKVYLFTGFAAIWTQPVSIAMDFTRKSFRAAIEADDLTFACYSRMCQPPNMFLVGAPLDNMWRESEENLAFVRQVQFRDVEDAIISHQRFIAAMQGRTVALSRFSDAAFDEEAFEAQLTEGRMPQMCCWYWIIKLEAGFLAGDQAAAFSAADKAKPLLHSTVAQIQALSYHYYSALTMTAAYDTAKPDDRLVWRARLTTHQAQLQEWTNIYPPTFGDKHALVSAEIARIDGRDLDAMRLYQQAIASASDNGFAHNEGIAYECAAAFYRTRGFDLFADAYIHKARDCFARWGASGKVAQLEALHPALRAQPAAAPALAAGAAQLDALAVAKASQAISGRIVLDELVDTLMRIVLENAGAQRGSLLLARDGEWLLAADANVDRQTTQVRLQLIPVAAAPLSPPESILNYVRRSREQVLLGDTAQPHLFSSDDYFTRHRPKSVLCLPILRQEALIGMLYVENSLVTHAFTPQRLTVLELLAAQAAISLENALLYTDLKRENSERRRTEARIRRLVESNIIGVFFWDLGGGISDANDAFLRMVGYSRRDLLSGNVDWAGMTPPEYRATDARALEELVRTGSCAPYEKAYLRKDGGRVAVLLGAALFEGSQEDGVAFVLDLTEQKQSEAERQARQVAEAANQAKSVFLANMSHELRTPLNGILGYAQLLRGPTLSQERQLAGINAIQQAGEHLLTLINDILDFAKIEAGKLELYEAPVNLPVFLQAIVDMIRLRAEQKSLLFVYDVPMDLPAAAQADEKRLRQILLNLLGNAVKFTDRGQVALRVTVLARSDAAARLRFEIQDTGIGISDRLLANLFQPFEQVGDAQRRLGGTGLGLAITRQLVQLMHSDIHVETKLNEGSLFWFELSMPVATATPAPAAARRITGYHGPRKKILIVDDVANNRAMLGDLLETVGFDPIEAANGQQALAMAEAQQPDCVLMDIVMPDMNGLEATRRLRQLPQLAHVPIIALSAGAATTDQDNGLAIGANAFLPKPINLNRLLRRMGELLRLRLIYAEPEEALAADTEAAEALVPPPPQEIAALHRLARVGNMRAIRQQAAHVASLDERYRPFANKLHSLAEGFQSQDILRLIEECLDKENR